MFLIFFFSQMIFAQIGVVTDSMGGAGIAGSHPLESAILNPAALIDFKVAYMGAQSYAAPVSSTVDVNQYTVYLTDAGEETLVPGNFLYRRRIFSSDGVRLREDQFQLSFAAALASSISVGGSAYKLRTDLPSGQDYNQHNVDLGGFWQVQKNLNLAMVFRGVLGSKDVFWQPSQILPSFGVGSQWTLLELFRLRYDMNYFLEQNSQERVSHHIGAEVHYDIDIVLRTGFSNDDRRRENRWTAGVAWQGPKLKFGYAYQKELKQKLGDMHTIDIWLDF